MTPHSVMSRCMSREHVDKSCPLGGFSPVTVRPCEATGVSGPYPQGVGSRVWMKRFCFKQRLQRGLSSWTWWGGRLCLF